MNTLVIIPTYNECDAVTSVVSGVLRSAPAGTDVLVVDDGSPDGTGACVEALSVGHGSRVRLLQRGAKLGLGSAYRAGFADATARGYDVVCTMDADGSHDPADLPALLAVVAAGADLVIGSRRVKGGSVVGWGIHRHFMSYGAMAAARWTLRLKTHDVTAGFRCYRASLVRELLAQGVVSDGYAFQEETVFLAEKLGYDVREVPVMFRDRRLGVSKLSWREVAQFFASILRLRSAKPSRIVTTEPSKN